MVCCRREFIDARLVRPAVTLVELLVVIGVIGLLVAITIPAVQSTRNAARKTLCSSNLRQVGLAISSYEAAHGYFPPGQTWVPGQTSRRASSFSWAAHVLSFLEQETLAAALDFRKPFLDPVNLAPASQRIPSYICPATALREAHRNREDQLFGAEAGAGQGLACLDYLGIAGPSKSWNNSATGMDYGPQRGILIGIKGLSNEAMRKRAPYVRARHVIDGLSKTACVTECSGRGLDADGDYHGTWVCGRNISHVAKGINASKPPKAWTKERIYSQHSGGAQFLFADVSVRFLPTGTEKKILKAICSRDGEEVDDEVF